MSTDEKAYILSPVGRIVAGHPTTANTTGYQGAELRDKQGNPKVEYFFALAVEQTNPEWEAFWSQIVAKAQQDFRPDQWQSPEFKWKIANGNSPKFQGREGYAGHHIIHYKSGYAPAIVDLQCQHLDSSRIKRGDYVRVNTSVAGNKDTGSNAGLFINPGMIQLCGYGQEIISGPSAQEVFGNSAIGYTPAGMSATPVAPVATPAPPGTAIPPAQMPPPQTALPAMVPNPQTAAPVVAPLTPTATAPTMRTMAMPPAPTTAPGVASPSNVQPAYDFLQPGQLAQPTPATVPNPQTTAPVVAPSTPPVGPGAVPMNPIGAPAVAAPSNAQPAMPGIPNPALGGDYIPHQ